MITDDANEDLMRHLLVPVAHERDARATARALRVYEPKRVTVLHIVEKGEGVPDKTPLEQSEAIATDSFATFRSFFPDAEAEVVYARDVVGAIFEVADAVGASAIAYRTRGGGRIAHLLSGDLSLKLVTSGDCPVISLPRVDPDT